MKKILSNLILLLLLSSISLIIILSTIGIETNKFNNLISKKINQINNNINLKITTIKFKIDIKKISLFLETKNPQINYSDILIPVKNIKVYIDFVSLIKSQPKIRRINLILNQLDIEQLKKISATLKPSNFTSFVNNRIKQGRLNTELEVYFDNNNLLENFIVRGSVTNLKAEIIKAINLEKTNFSFFADSTDVLIKNIFGEVGPIKIKNGDLKLKLGSEIQLESNFGTTIKYDGKSINLKNFSNIHKYFKNIINLEAEFNNSFLINLDETYKIKKYDYKNKGKIAKANFDLTKPLESNFLIDKIKKISLTKSEVKMNFNPKKNITAIAGQYSLNEGNFLLFDLENIAEGALMKLKLNADYDKSIELDFINYQKQKDTVATFSLNLEKKKIILK